MFPPLAEPEPGQQIINTIGSLGAVRFDGISDGLPRDYPGVLVDLEVGNILDVVRADIQIAFEFQPEGLRIVPRVPSGN